uniref:Uncharacterized protein n=1 Tax=Anguilla anguilla TaxID=7936 RepID=A0A0E9WF13_ANGAN
MMQQAYAHLSQTAFVFAPKFSFHSGPSSLQYLYSLVSSTWCILALQDENLNHHVNENACSTCQTKVTSGFD